MKNILLVLALVPAFAQAGGIALRKEYKGIHPLTGTEILLQIEHPGTVMSAASDVTMKVAGSFLNLGDSQIAYKSYNAAESVFEIRDADGDLIASVITEPPCTTADNVALVFASGLTAILKSSAP